MLKEQLSFKGTWRTYQKRVLDHFDQYKQDRKLHIVAAPGSGKTTLGIELITQLDACALVLTPSITIREQWISRIEQSFLNDPTKKEELLSQDLKHPKLITVVTYQALHSAIHHYQGELVDEQDDFHAKEIVDYKDFDLFQCFKDHHIQTLCLDECHHLRSEWWKALEEVKKEIPNLYTISLTATPPYDDTLAMWNRYISMCGEIDEEITIPELVKQHTLCPHQDYVYFNYPTKEEEKEIESFKKMSQQVVENLSNSQTFRDAIATHRFFTESVPYDEVLENPKYLSSMLILLEKDQPSKVKEYQRLLGSKSLDSMNAKWMEELLQGFLYDDYEHYQVDEAYRKDLIKELKAHDCIDRRTVCLQMNKALEKVMIRSTGKCNSIKEIVKQEYETMKEKLRLLILTDYIRAEYEPYLGDTKKDFTNLGVLPFFELLRQEHEQLQSGLKFAVLCGTMIIIPSSAQQALLSLVEEPSRIRFQPAGHLQDYVRVEVSGDKHFITQVITDLFSQGYFEVLIGTKSLLGEGWDSPCVNTLILASFVGSYMLSNQMRGRAIRTDASNPNKSSNIWHLVCVNPKQANGLYDMGTSEDYRTLERRMDHFLGLHYTQDSIENGMERMTAITLPFTKANVKKTNEAMLANAKQRDSLQDRWQRSLAIYDEIEIVDETAMKEENIPGMVFIDAIRSLILSIAFVIVSIVLFTGIAGLFTISSGILIGLFVVIVFPWLLTAIFQSKKVFRFKNPMNRLRACGEGILKALMQMQFLHSVACRVECEHDEPFHFLYLKGGTNKDKLLFTQCVDEFFAEIDNQRYILYNPKRKNRMDGYYVVPSCFSKRKEDAQIFASCMKPLIGNYEVVYTRQQEGRKILLEGRIHALSNRQQRCIHRQKVKGALE